MWGCPIGSYAYFGVVGIIWSGVGPGKMDHKWIARWNLGIDNSFSFFHVLVQRGVGINFSPRPNNERRFFAGCLLHVKSWNAKWEGREK